MDKKEAVQILEKELETFRDKTYSELTRMIGAEPITMERSSPEENWYQIEIQVFWDDKPKGDVRVAGSIDDGGWRAYLPLCRDFIMAPDNSFVDE